MNHALPVVCLVRHADTAWTLSGQHTLGRTDQEIWVNPKCRSGRAIRHTARKDPGAR
jgi:hypothetical protein